MKARSLLFVPADSESKLDKTRESSADLLILDLEDAVVTARKPVARQLAAAHLSATQGLRNWQAFVRINPLDTPDALHDLAALVGNGVDGIVLPKADGAEDVVRLGSYLDALETRAGLPLGTTRIIVVCTETARAILNAGSYTRGLPRLVGLTWGAEDLSVALGAVTNRENDGKLSHAYLMARSTCLIAAAAADVAPIDTLYANYRDPAGLEADCHESRRRGFVGKVAIHPDQVEIINSCFSANTEDIELARAVVEAFAANPDAGTIGINGKMYDRPHLVQARRTLTRLDARA
jgi:citrate lyase subunit beta/citryl-CoA lyase